MLQANIKTAGMSKEVVALDGATASTAFSKGTASISFPAGKKSHSDIGSTVVDKVEGDKNAIIVERISESLKPASEQKFGERVARLCQRLLQQGFSLQQV